MVGRKNKMVIVTLNSDYGGGKRKEVQILGCECGGKYKPYKGKLTRKTFNSLKCECPFRLRGRPNKSEGCWKLRVVCGFHNHELSDSFVGHAYVGRLNCGEKKILKEMVDNKVKPGLVLRSLQGKNPSSTTPIDQVYSATKRYKKTKRGPVTEMQYLMQMLERDKYVYWYTKDDETLVIENIFWAHPRSIEMFNIFPTVVLIEDIQVIHEPHMVYLLKRGWIKRRIHGYGLHITKLPEYSMR